MKCFIIKIDIETAVYPAYIVFTKEDIDIKRVCIDIKLYVDSDQSRLDFHGSTVWPFDETSYIEFCVHKFVPDANIVDLDFVDKITVYALDLDSSDQL